MKELEIEIKDEYIIIFILLGFLIFYSYFAVFRSKIGFADEIQYSIISQEIAGKRPEPGEEKPRISIPNFRARRSKLGNEITNKRPLFRPQLLPILESLFYLVGLTPEILAPLFGVTTLAGVYVFCAKFINKTVGTLSVLVLGLLPIFVEHSILLYVDMLTTLLLFFSTLTFWLGFKKKKRKYFVLAGIFFALALLTKETGILLPVILFFSTIPLFKNRAKKEIFLAFLIFGLVGSLGLVWYARNIKVIGSPTHLTTFGIFKWKYPIGARAEIKKYYRDYKWLVFEPWQLFHYVGYPFLFLTFSGIFTKGLDKNIKKMMITWIISYLVLFFSLSNTVGHRHLLPAYVFCSVLAGQFLAELKGKNSYPRFALVVLILCVMIFYATEKGNIIVNVRKEKPERMLKSVFEWIKENTSEDSVILTPWEVELNYWTGRTGAWFVAWGLEDLGYYMEHPEINPIPYLKEWGIDYILVYPTYTTESLKKVKGVAFFPRPWVWALTSKYGAKIVYQDEYSSVLKI